MAQISSHALPKLRALDVRRVVHQGQRCLLLRDPLGLTQQTVLVPEEMALLLSLCDGTRDIPTLAAGFLLRTGIPLSQDRVAQIVESLSQALLLEDERSAEAQAAARREYQEAPFRKPALAGKGYPADPQDLEATLRRYCQEVAARDGAPPAVPGPIVGLISPHIDYQRGWPVYARVWQHAAGAIAEADLVIIFGTDHAGGPGRLTLTTQCYATPWGALPTDRAMVDALAHAIGEEEAFAEELHHRNEHSIELALVWLHYFLRPRTCEVVPILCGSFSDFIVGKADPATHQPFHRALDVLRQACARRRTLVVAAADLAHVGPAFGDIEAWGPAHRARLRASDEVLLQAIGQGNARRFFATIRQMEDRHRVCGMPPVYLMLRMLDGARGATLGYDQCPADAEHTSLVSIAGMVLTR